ncbi:MAG: response regulator [Magnetococcales bacterium]|nr:response regulator [Magnetococcales bacterium]
MTDLDPKQAEKIPFYQGIGRRLLLWFMTIAILPLAGVMWGSYENAKTEILTNADQILTNSLVLKTRYIEKYLDEELMELDWISRSPTTLRFLEDLIASHEKSGLTLQAFTQSAAWQALATQHKNELENFRESFEYTDIYLLDLDGNVLFALKDTICLGTNVPTGDKGDTPFGLATKEALRGQGAVISDLEIHEASRGQATFLTMRQVKDGAGHPIGLAAIRLTSNEINEFLSDRTGLGLSGETYLVGRDGFMRSNSRFETEPTVLKKEIDTLASHLWFHNEIETHGSAWTGRKPDMSAQVHDFEKMTEEPLTPLSEINATIFKVAQPYPDYRGKMVLGWIVDIAFIETYGLEWALIAEIDANEAFAPIAELKARMIFTLAATTILVFLVAVLVTGSIVGPLRRLTQWSKQIAAGNLQYADIKTPPDELGALNQSFREMVDSLLDVSEVCQVIALGDIGAPLTIRSTEDVTGRAVNQMRENLSQVIEQANAIAQGDYSIEITPRSSRDTLSTSLLSMTHSLREMSSRNERDQWQKSGQTILNDRIRGEQEPAALAATIIRFLADHMEARVGTFYQSKAEGALELLGSYALIQDQSPATYQPGEGLVGQAVVEKEPILVTNVPEHYLPIHSSLGEGTPRNILIYPIVRNGSVLGVLELGSLNEFNSEHLAFLDLVTESIALAIIGAVSNQQLKEMLQQTRQQALELEAKGRQLTHTNQKLQEQTEELQASEEELKEQQAELQATNEALMASEEELKKQQEEIRATNEALLEKTEHLENNQSALEEAQHEIEEKARHLEEVSRYKSQFLSNMSHELRTPLNSLLILAKNLTENEENNLTSEQIEAAQIIHASGSDLLSLINDILDLSKVESGKMELHTSWVETDDMALFLKRHFTHVAKDKGLTLQVDVLDGTPTGLSSDEGKISQVLKNLVANAIKYTDQGTVSVRFRPPPTDRRLSENELRLAAPEHLAASKALAIEVEDSGIGIPSEKYESIFQAFKQADGTTSRKYGGTGLGLSISRELTRLLGGEIRLMSREGQGSVFTLLLPKKIEEAWSEPDTPPTTPMGNPLTRRASDRRAPRSPPVITSPPPASPPVVDDLKIITSGDRVMLIVTADQNEGQVLLEMTREKGFKGILAKDGTSGLALIAKHEPTAILLDASLPGLDGMEVMERLKQDPETRHLPVHILSDDIQKDQLGLKKGAAGLIQRPVNKKRMAEIFRQIERLTGPEPRQLLIVEDNSVARKELGRIFASPEVQVIAVGNGEKALNLLKKRDFDCLILDLGLPDMTGMEMLERMARKKYAAKTPVIVHSARDLSREEILLLRKYTESIVIKGVHSQERLLDEATLFLHRPTKKLPKKQRSMLEKRQDPAQAFQGRTILLVDDDMRNTFALKRILEPKGLKVVPASNGREAMEELQKSSDIDLILMDVMMPEMDGFEAIRNIRGDARFQEIIIIGLSAKASPEDRNDLLKVGANDYLSKPVDQALLLAKLRNWLEKYPTKEETDHPGEQA